MSNNPTSVQIDVLLSFLEEHRELALGHSRNAERRNRSKKLWDHLTDELNALGGCIKNVKQWQKVWADKKYLAKKAAAANRRSASATGGGPSSAEQLTAQQLRIISMMGEGYGEAETDARVPAFPEVPVTSEHVQDVMDTEFIVSLAPEVPQQQQNQHSAQQHPRPSAAGAARLERRRRRVDAIGPERNVRRRLFDMEEQRIATESRRVEELTLIRQSLQELCIIIQAGFQGSIARLFFGNGNRGIISWHKSSKSSRLSLYLDRNSKSGIDLSRNVLRNWRRFLRRSISSS